MGYALSQNSCYAYNKVYVQNSKLLLGLFNFKPRSRAVQEYMVIERYIDLAVVGNLIVSRLKLSNVFEVCFTVLDLVLASASVDSVVIKCMPEAQECKFTLCQTDTICSLILVVLQKRLTNTTYSFPYEKREHCQPKLV